MSVKRSMSDGELRRFEGDLLGALRRDPDHQFAFDGVLKVQSTRYRCLLRAVNVKWDERRGDAVFVGAFVSGEPQFDCSRGYPVVKSEVEIPFRECFFDLEKMGGFGGRYLVTKTRKAVIEKCLAHPLRVLSGYDALERDGSVRFGSFLDKFPRINGGAEAVGSVSKEDGFITLRKEDGTSFNLSGVSLIDIQRVGMKMDEVRSVVKGAREAYVKARTEAVGENRMLSDRDDRAGAVAGLRAVYDAGFPLGACRSVARTYSPSDVRVFDESLHSAREVDAMMRSFREGRGSFGFNDGEKRTVTLRLL